MIIQDSQIFSPTFEDLRIIIQAYSKEKDHGDMDRISYQRY
jgi:hypothetical protein